MSNHKSVQQTNTALKGASTPPAAFKMAGTTLKTPGSPSPAALALARSSFSSIRERDADFTQAFSSTKVSSYSGGRLDDEVAIMDASDDASIAPRNMDGLQCSQLHDVEDVEPAVAAPQPIERLPIEVYYQILDHLILDTPPNGIDRRNVDLVSLLVSSRSIYNKTIEALYRRVIIPHSRTFQKFRAQLEAAPVRGTWVRRLDFSHFNPVSLFSTASERQAARNLTSKTLLRCLNLTPKLHEFLAQDYLDRDIDEPVLRKLLFNMPGLKALDLCGCSAPGFWTAFAAIVSPFAGADVAAAAPVALGIQRLSLHKCNTLPAAVFDFLLPKLTRATHLDLAGTRVTDAALHSLPATARLSHLNLAKCSLLTPGGVIDFLANHPAVNQGSLVFLSLGCDAATAQLLDVDDVSRLLPILPRSLKSLGLKGSKMDRRHLPQLRLLATHLEELALGRGLALCDVRAIVLPPPSSSESASASAVASAPHTLHYLDLSDMNASDFDLSYLYIDSHLLDAASSPLEAIEVTEEVFKRVSKSRASLDRMGWRQSEISVRSWLVRGRPAAHTTASASGSFTIANGQRPWKMGAQAWGMRKIPVAHAKVGGMYGSYMFGRNL